MRTRAYRPEALAGLEDRSLLSAGVGPTATPPVAISRHRFNFVRNHIGQGFNQFIRNHDPGQILNELEDVLPLIPHAGATDLEGTARGIVQQMHQNLRAGVPGSVRLAYVQVIAATRASAQSGRGPAS